VRRAGLIRPERYLERLASEIKQLAETPGHRVHSLEEASFDAWIKFYRPDETTPNTTVSYYLKGALVAAILDLELRQRTGGRRSLDDVMRALWQRYRLRQEGYSESSLEAVFAEVAGGPVADLFDTYVRGVADLDLDRHLTIAGLKLSAVMPEEERADRGRGDGAGAAAPPKPVAGDLGVRTRASGDRVVITHVLEGRPAARSGLYPGDELLALDGFRVTDRGLSELLECLGPGAEVEATLFRRDELLRVPVKLGPPLPTKLRLERVPDAPPLAQRIYEQWLETTWEPVEAPAPGPREAAREPTAPEPKAARRSRAPAPTAKASATRRAPAARSRPVKAPPKRGGTKRAAPQGSRRKRR
jgi:predicted metalloprotease with PDZ domain